MRYYIIAGEASGDLHGSNLIRELRKMDAGAVIRCWGGDLMQAAGGNVVKHYRDLAFMGFTEVVKNLPTILNNLKFYAIVVTPPTGQPIFFFRKYSKAKEIHRSRSLFAALLSR
ncbi:MAG: hypothetical protein ICV82_02940, partial [Nitrososphaera sp.]|nr:hypothetical protein [Nitrososphaera sp.]